LSNTPTGTFVGRISRGFDFLGYTFSTVGLTGIARKTIAGFVERMNRLYEHGADAIRIGQYVRRWRSWVTVVSDETHLTFAMSTRTKGLTSHASPQQQTYHTQHSQ